MKRVAENQGRRGEEEDVVEDMPMTGFQKADEATLSKRKIKGMPKRAGSATPTPTDMTMSSIKTDSSFSTPSAITASTTTNTFGGGFTGFTPLLPTPPSSSSPVASHFSSSQRKLKYYQGIRGLNADLTDFLTRTFGADPFADVSSVLERYSEHLKKIKEELGKVDQEETIKTTTTTTTMTTSGTSGGVMPKPPSGGFKGFAGFGIMSNGTGGGGGGRSALSTAPSSSSLFGVTTSTTSTTTSNPFSLAKADTSSASGGGSSTTMTNTTPPLLFAKPPTSSTSTTNESSTPKPAASSLFGSPSIATPTPPPSSSSSFFRDPKPQATSTTPTPPTSGISFGSSSSPSGGAFGFTKPIETTATAPGDKETPSSSFSFAKLSETNTTSFSFAKPSSSSTEGSLFKPPSSSGFSAFGGFGVKPASSTGAFGSASGSSSPGSIGNPLGFGFGTTSGLTSGDKPTSGGSSSFFALAKPATAESSLSDIGEGGESTDVSRDVTPSVLGGPNPHDEEGEGEEDEETVHQVKSKAMILSGDEEKRWNELGTGFLRIKQHKEHKTCRLLLRNSSNGKINVNFSLYKNMKPTVKSKSVMLMGHDEGKERTYLFKVASVDSANELKSHIESRAPA